VKIGVNTRLLQYGKLEGIGRFTHETLSRLTHQMQDCEFVFYFDRPYHPSFIYHSNVKPRIVPPPARHPFLYWIWLEWALPYFFYKDRIDLFFSPDGFLSLNTKVPQIPVFHDLAFEHFPEGISKIGAWYYKRYMPKFANIAKHILTVSEFTKKDIIQTYPMDSSKITVTCNGVSSIFRPLTLNEIENVRKKYARGKPYILFVGSIHPRKNLARLLQAFEQFKQETSHEAQLLICGRKAWNFEDIFTYFDSMTFKNDVHFTGTIHDEELSKIYGAASVLCYVSLFEGFGIPILEAFASHIPVITSNVSSMSEVAGDAALLVNPYQVEEIQYALKKIFFTPQLAQDLVNKGIKRLAFYSWEKASSIIEATLRKFSNS
jgi:glycosyltransferase involved in cell wall biosynthesis